MPFVNQEHREHPNPDVPGDRCFTFYKEIMDTWRKNPSWATADKLFEMVINLQHNDVSNANKRAAVLAFMVFFCREVMPYEEKKAIENGEV